LPAKTISKAWTDGTHEWKENNKHKSAEIFLERNFAVFICGKMIY
jgi:hypothetical protein